MPELVNDRHERFCEEFLVDCNATAAYQRAYPQSSEASARASSADLLANPSVSSRLAELQSERAQRVQLRLDDVVRELMLLGFSDVRNFETDDAGHLMLREGAPETAWRAVASVKHRTTSNGDFTVHEVEYRMWNKNDALKQLRDHLAGAQGTEDEDVIPLATIRKAIQRAGRRAS